MPRLHDSVILLSGAGGALAYGLIERCLQEGARVTVLEDDAARATQLHGDFGTELLVVNADSSSLVGHQQALELTLARHHRLDGYVANGMCWGDGLRLAELPADDRLRTGFDTLVGATVWRYLCGARVVADALGHQHGSMVFSLAGTGGVLASATRHAGVGLVRQLARELAPAVRVNGVCAVPAPRERGGPFAEFAIHRADAPTNDVLAPRYAPDPAVQIERFLALLLPHTVSRVTGTVLECDDADIEGLLSLA
jgi:NAD(P)-dependent dehydrogenase (short-subunit alcohol dehydrogenase family)